MSSSPRNSSDAKSWLRTLERFVLILLVAIGGTSIVGASWARDYAEPRATLLGSTRGISVLVTAGTARVLIVNGTDPAALGNAVSKARHPGLDRIDLLIVSGNAAAADLVPRAVTVLNPREVMTVGGVASLAGTEITPRKVIDRSTTIELPEGVTISFEVWPAAEGENGDVTWSVLIERGSASIYWVSDREALDQVPQPEEPDLVVIGRGAPGATSPLPETYVIVAAGESIDGPELRAVTFETLGPNVETKRVFAGEALRIDLDLTGIRSVSGSTPAGSPVPA